MPKKTFGIGMNCLKHNGPTNRGSDLRIGGVVAPDLRGVNLVPHQHPPPSSPPTATLTLTPSLSTL